MCAFCPDGGTICPNDELNAICIQAQTGETVVENYRITLNLLGGAIDRRRSFGGGKETGMSEQRLSGTIKIRVNCRRRVRNIYLFLGTEEFRRQFKFGGK